MDDAELDPAASAAEGAGANGAAPRKGLSFTELAAAAAAPAPAAGAGTLELEQVGDESWDDSYGYFNDIKVDGSTRLDWIRENIKPDPRVK